MIAARLRRPAHQGRRPPRREENGPGTLQPTASVRDVFLRMTGTEPPDIANSALLRHSLPVGNRSNLRRLVEANGELELAAGPELDQVVVPVKIALRARALVDEARR